MTIIWATRGRSWGFRFLLDGGFHDPLKTYEAAFAGAEGEASLFRRVGTYAALRFPDPSGRRDQSGRVIPHDIVALPPLADEISSFDDGVRLIWPRLAETYSHVWAEAQPPSRAIVAEFVHGTSA